MVAYVERFRESIDDPGAFWGREAGRIFWKQPPVRVLDASRSPFNVWFEGGRTNLCYNAVDRWALGERRGSAAIIWESPETGQSRTVTFFDLYHLVVRFAGVLKRLGVKRGDRVVIYMPNLIESAVAMLACVRIGAVHSVVFGGFAPENLAQRIDDAGAVLAITCDGSSRGGKPTPIKPLLDKALALTRDRTVRHVICLHRGLLPREQVFTSELDLDWAAELDATPFKPTEPEWLESSDPSYILYTSGTTGKPKGVVRDTGGYAVALTTSMDYIYNVKQGDVYFSTSDIGWVVGHSYIVYGPLLAGIPTVMFEGTPVYPRPTIWWETVEKHGVTCVFSAPTAFRVLKGYGEEPFRRYDLSALKCMFLAGEPLDKPTQEWASHVMPGTTIVDHYWQTESGWAMLANCVGIEKLPIKPGSPTKPAYGYDLSVVNEQGERVPPGEKGFLVCRSPLPPGTLTTIWRDDERFIRSYFTFFPGHPELYLTGDYAIEDADGYFWVLGRADEVINIAGHRLGTAEVESAISSHPKVAEVTAVGVPDELKGQAVIALVILKQGFEPSDALARELVQTVADKVGAIAKPRQVLFAKKFPKTRSGKIMRRVIKEAAVGGRDYGNISTIEDPTAIEEVERLLKA
jgi:propionyl-CoA synthetase